MFAVVVGQRYVTALWTGLMLVIYRSRPDIEAADAAASVRRYRRFLAPDPGPADADRAGEPQPAAGRAAELAALPALGHRLGRAAGAFRGRHARAGGRDGANGPGGYRLAGGGRRPGPGLGLGVGADRDDDRFWKAGLIYVNRDDPAIMVGARFGVGWTFNFANPLAWMIIGGIVAAPTGLALILRAAAM